MVNHISSAQLAAIITCMAIAAALLGMPQYYVHLMVLMVIFAILSTSLNILMGYGGLPSLGHAAFYGLAAYGVGIAVVKFGLPLWVGIAIGLSASGLAAVLFGLVALRTQGVYFLLITLALGQLLWGAANRWGSLTGGFNGLPGVPRPVWLSSTSNFFLFALAVLIAVFFLVKRLVESPFGLALRAISESESRMQALGYNTWLHKYLAFILAGILAGVAGVMSALYNGFVSPYDLSITLSSEIILMVIVGGTRSLWGPVVGAIAVVLLRNLLSIWFEHWLLLLGAIFILVVLFAPQGLTEFVPGRGRARRVSRANGRNPSSAADRSHDQATSDNNDMALALEGLTKIFGGMNAVKDVHFSLRRGDRAVLLGPNGAGKTTLFKVIAGALPASSGKIVLFGRNIEKLPSFRRARLGIGRTFQITNLFSHLTVEDHLRLCVLARKGYRMGMLRRADRIPAVNAALEAELEQSLLGSFRDREVKGLSYGHQRQLEFAMAVATKPRLLLLDEPAAGLSKSEIAPIIDRIKGLDPSIAMLLVEHDMDVAFAVADRVTVFNHGEVVAQGSPAEVAKNDEVSRIYLGRRRL